MMQVRRTHAWLVLAGYVCLALAIPVLTPVPERLDTLPPIAPLVLVSDPDDDARMQPLRMQANAAMQALQRHPETF
ncbi:MAG TPA: hypothetical protein VEJ40_05110 [Pseudolabrys sp.]|nr:hypothetical protein [Pseudolabrys sp.]